MRHRRLKGQGESECSHSIAWRGAEGVVGGDNII